MKRQDINQQINEEILSGGGRTRAQGTRSVLHNLADSMLNTFDHPQYTETPLASGSSNTYVAAYSELPSGYESGYLYKINFGAANTGAATININGLGQKLIRRSNGSDLEAGDLEGVVLLAYTGSVFQLVGGTSMSSGDLVHRTGNETIAGVKTFEDLPILPDADPEADNEAAHKKYVDSVAETILEEVETLKTEIENIPVVYTHVQQFVYSAATIEIEGIEYPCVSLNHEPISIISAHIDHTYVYSDEYILDGQTLAFRFDNLVESDVIEVVYSSNSKPSVFDSAIISLREGDFDNPYNGVDQYKDIGNSDILNEYTLHVEFVGHSSTEGSFFGCTIFVDVSYSAFAGLYGQKLSVGAVKGVPIQHLEDFVVGKQYAVTIVATNSVATVYIDGELVVSGNLLPFGATRLPRLYFAAFNNESEAVNFANCSGRRLAIWDRALSQEEVLQLLEEV